MDTDPVDVRLHAAGSCRWRRYAVLLCAVLLAGCAVTREAIDLRALVESTLETSGAPAVGAALVSSEGVIQLVVEGRARLGGNDPVDAGAAFHAGSLAKPMTALMVAHLVESGKLNWNMRLADVFPEAVKNGNPAYRDIELLDLVAHRTSLPPLTVEEEIVSLPVFAGDTLAQRRAFVEWVLRQPPSNGTGYSNAAYVVLAAFLEAVTGTPWETLMREEIFMPLEMNSAGFGWPCRDDRTGCPWGHEVKDGRLVPVDPDSPGLPRFFAPAGDIHASLSDIGRFAAEYLRAYAGRPALISREMGQRMLTADGIGWGVQEAFGFAPFAIHMGSANTFIMIVALVPEIDRAVVVVANAASNREEERLLSLLRSIAESM